MAVSENAKYRCPVCGFVGFDEPPWDEIGSPSYDICPSCGIEFGYDDFRQDDAERQQRWRELREKWITGGMRWTSTVDPQPPIWDPQAQLREITETKRNGREGKAQNEKSKLGL